MVGKRFKQISFLFFLLLCSIQVLGVMSANLDIATLNDTYVPYIGAINDTNLGLYNLTAGNISTDCITLGDGFEYCTFQTKYYNATSIEVITGTTAGDLSYTQHSDAGYDGRTLNLTERVSAPAMDIRFNFTDGIESFTQGVMRYRTSVLSGDAPIIQLWDFEDSVWEDYPEITESPNFKTISQSVFDSSEHLLNGTVIMRFYKAGNGNINNKYYIDWLAISKGFGVPSPEEIDPEALHKDGSTLPTGNLDWNGYNITDADYLIANTGNFTNLIIENITSNNFNIDETNGDLNISSDGTINLVSWVKFIFGFIIPDNIKVYFGDAFNIGLEYDSDLDALSITGGNVNIENNLTIEKVNANYLEWNYTSYPYNQYYQKGSFPTEDTGTLVGVRTYPNMRMNVNNGIITMNRTQGVQADINVGDIIEVTDCTNTSLNGLFVVDQVSNDNGGYDFLNLTSSTYDDLTGMTITDDSACKSQVWRILLGQKSGIWEMAYYKSDDKLVNYNMNTYHWTATINDVNLPNMYRYRGGVHYEYGYSDAWGWSAHELECLPFNKTGVNSVIIWCGVSNTADNEISNNRIGLEPLKINYETRVAGKVVYVGNPKDYYQLPVITE